MTWISKRRAFLALILMISFLLAAMCTVYLANKQFYQNGLKDLFLDLYLLRKGDIFYSVLKNGVHVEDELSYMEKLYVYTFSEALNGLLIELRHIPHESLSLIDIAFVSLGRPIPIEYDYRKECNDGLFSTFVRTHIVTDYDLKSKTVASSPFNMWTNCFYVFNYYDDSGYIGYGCKVEYDPTVGLLENFVPEGFKTTDLDDPELKQIPSVQDERGYFILQNWR